MEGEGTDDEDAISRFEETVVLQAASALFVKPPALAGTVCGDGDGNGLTVLAGIGHAAVDQDAVNAILNSDDRDLVTVDTRKGGYQYDASATTTKPSGHHSASAGGRGRFGRREPVQQLGKWSAGEILGLCKAVDMNGRRLEGVDVQLATLLVPTRSPEAILTRLLDFRPSYAEYTQRRLDRSLRNQAESQAESQAVAASPPLNPTKRSKRRKLDDGAGASDDSGSGAAPPCCDGGGGEDAAGWSHQAAGGEAAALAALLSVPKSLEERKKMGGKERRAALDLVLSQTEMGAAPINVEARRSTLDRFLDRQETTEDKISRLDAVLDQQATE